MCGRYQFSLEESEEIRDIIREVQRKNQAVKTGEIFPTNCAPVLFMQDGRMSADALNWGFPQFGGKSGVVINARSETALEKPMFRKSVEFKRCIIPTTGFFEWSQGQRQKYLFRQSDQAELYLAGIYNDFRGELRYVILTTAANESVVDIHNRMPVVIRKGEQQKWLTDYSFALAVLQSTPPALIKIVV